MNTIPIGVLYSSQSQYRKVSYQSLIGTQFGISQVNANPRFDFKLGAIHKDPFGERFCYVTQAERLFQQGIEHVFGTTTLDSRMATLDVVQQHSGLLWTSSLSGTQPNHPNLLKFGPSSEQHLLPLLTYSFAKYGTHAAVVSPNDQLGWDLSKLTSSFFETGGGTLSFNNFYREGCQTFDYTLNSLLNEPPKFVVNHLMGNASYAFLKAFNQRWQGNPIPVICTHLSRSESVALGALPNLVLLCGSNFFEQVNPIFSQRVYRDFAKVYVSGGFVSAYLSVLTLAYSIKQAGSSDPKDIKRALSSIALPVPFGGKATFSNQCLEQPSFLAQLNKEEVTLLDAEVGTSEKESPFISQVAGVE
ncbi:transporter substrate-binding protein [Vibrio sp. S9_S30]|uniref:transporter substrate-binding protein n=1 Tax=Vibrio sp. S9_S30 TaxID=2720226 RepID=UPI001680BE34|nr:transporter substrate-binding protein [Vibrio sp. S9_S30]MBD1559413.1 transporter substrate-binding protein [Vibrio sp. S9_S30]